jgi:hypothetical protein
MIVKELSNRRMPLVAVCSYGRSGTSVLMKLLRCLGLTVTGEMPFEDRTTQVAYLRWLAGSMKVSLPSEANQAIFAEIVYKSFIDAPEAELLQPKVLAWLDELRAAKSRGLAEKFVGTVVLRSMKGLDDDNYIRPLYLIRDPRDIFISVKRFNEKRGFSSFNDRGDDEQLLRVICGFMREQLRLQRRLGGLVYKYEQIVGNAREAIFDIHKFAIGGEMHASYLDELEEQFANVSASEVAHMTSDSSAESILRWRNDEHAGYAELFKKFSSSIFEIGYAP